MLEIKIVMKKILVVCSFNMYRSAIAEAILKKELGKKAKIDSAGTSTINGISPFFLTQRAVKELEKVDISKYTSEKINKRQIDWADSIIVMEDKHREYIVKRWAEAEKKIAKPLNVKNIGLLNTFNYNEYKAMVKEIRLRLKPLIKTLM